MPIAEYTRLLDFLIGFDELTSFLDTLKALAVPDLRPIGPGPDPIPFGLFGPGLEPPGIR
jgi:hypothetical protein